MNHHIAHARFEEDNGAPTMQVVEHASPRELAAARKCYQSDDVQIDDDAIVSRTGNAEVWVEAWVRIEGAEECDCERSGPCIDEVSLPTPRIEIRMDLDERSEGVVTCEENLVTALERGDPRREQLGNDLDLMDLPFQVVNINATSRDLPDGRCLVRLTSGGIAKMFAPEPMTSQSLNDARQLRLPLFLVASGRAIRLTDVRFPGH